MKEGLSNYYSNSEVINVKFARYAFKKFLLCGKKPDFCKYQIGNKYWNSNHSHRLIALIYKELLEMDMIKTDSSI